MQISGAVPPAAVDLKAAHDARVPHVPKLLSMSTSMDTRRYAHHAMDSLRGMGTPQRRRPQARARRHPARSSLLGARP